MCTFFSCISDGRGNVKFFTLDDIERILAEGNPEDYDFNSHTSIARFYGINGTEEDKWNKWEYREGDLEIDTLNNKNDKEQVQEKVEAYLKGKDFEQMRDYYKCRTPARLKYLNGCHASGLKVGDKVRVVRKAEDYEGGWSNGWTQEMDESVGKIYEIKHNDGWCGFILNYGDWRFGFPYFVLEKVEICQE